MRASLSNTEFCNVIHDFSFSQLVQSPTRGDNVLDLVLVNDSTIVSYLQVCDSLPGCDHDAIHFNLSLLPPKQTSNCRYLYNYTKANFDEFRASLSSVPWDIAVSDDIDTWWESWKDLFLAAVSSHVLMVRWRRSKMKCWLSPGTIKLIKKKRLVYRRLKRSFSDSCLCRYKRLRNLVRQLTRADYRAYADKISGSLFSDQKAFWSWINKTKRCRHPIPPVLHDGSLLTSDADKAQCFNDYFCSVFTIEDCSSLDDLRSNLDVSNSPVLLDLVQTTPSEVFELLSSLNCRKASGPDTICPRLLKEGAAEISCSLSKLFNKSLCDSVLPLDWVSANVCPVFKRGDKQSASNYRPISLTCIVSKLLEKIVHKHLYSLLESHDLLQDHQFGFRRKRSTTSLLMTAIHDWATCLDLSQTTHCLFLDMSKAFDSVPHRRLLLKLQLYGVGGALLTWFDHFLTTRRQRVSLNGCFSSWRHVTSGVPQGSILGPLLFILYIDDIAKSVDCKIKVFADDITIYQRILSIQDCYSLQHNLDSCLQWCSRWQMNLSPVKCEALCISNKRSPLAFTYQCVNQPIQWKQKVKYLGIYLNQHLTWGDHCKYVHSKATNIFNLLRRKLYGCSQPARHQSFCSLVLPILQYACQVWMPYYKKDITLIESVQKRASRWICGSSFNPCTYQWDPPSDACLAQLKWPYMTTRFTRLSLMFLHDLLHQKLSVKFSDFFQFRNSSTRSHRLTLMCKHSHINAYRYSFFVNVINFWNKLPLSVASISGRHAFASAVCNYFMN